LLLLRRCKPVIISSAAAESIYDTHAHTICPPNKRYSQISPTAIVRKYNSLALPNPNPPTAMASTQPLVSVREYFDEMVAPLDTAEGMRAFLHQAFKQGIVPLSDTAAKDMVGLELVQRYNDDFEGTLYERPQDLIDEYTNKVLAKVLPRRTDAVTPAPLAADPDDLKAVIEELMRVTYRMFDKHLVLHDLIGEMEYKLEEGQSTTRKESDDVYNRKRVQAHPSAIYIGPNINKGRIARIHAGNLATWGRIEADQEVMTALKVRIASGRE
jgi:hypothetical protein